MTNSQSNIDPEELSSYFKKLTEHITLTIEEFLPKDFNFNEHYKKFQKSIILLSENNWYPDFDMTMAQIIHAGQLLENNNIKQADELLMNYFDDEIESLRETICWKFPNRKKIIESAINAHINKEYYLSIPVFFSQAEGISQEIINIRFFKTSNGSPVTKGFLDDFDGGELTKDLLTPLRIISSNRQRQDFSNPLGINRHDVLHGQSTNYGDNPINSYKAFSLMNYISDIVYEASKD